jgi:hypothetical protein
MTALSVVQYAVGICAVLVVFLSAVVVGIFGRRILTPGWGGAPAALVTVVLGYSFLTVEGELLGTIGLFSRVPIVVASLVLAAAVVAAGQLLGVGVRLVGDPPASAEDSARSSDRGIAETASSPRWWMSGSMSSLAASACVALLLVQGLVALRQTARTGNVFIDALEYHLTLAAHMATSHHTGGIVQLAPSSPVPYYPLNSELLHGMGIALFHRDSLSLLLTLLDISVVLLAAWCIGSAFGVGAVTLCAISPLIALLGPYDSSAINDWAALWPLLALLAIGVHGHKHGLVGARGAPLVAGLAGGLAMGTKLNLLAPTAALLIGYIVTAPKARRGRSAVLLIIGAAVTSVYWYVRNVVDVGSPLPSQHIPGLPRVPMPELQKFGFSVAHYLSDGTVIRQFFHPGLAFFFGKAWIAILLLATLGVLIGLLKGPGMHRMAALVAVAATAAYLITPTGAFGPAGHPYLFGENLRYALPAVALGLLVLAASRAGTSWPVPAALAFLACLVVTLFGPRMWASGRATAVAAGVASGVAVLLVRVPQVRRHGVTFAVVAAFGVVVLGYPANRHYLQDRYHVVMTPQEALYSSLQDQEGQRIGVVGSAALYPFLGATYTNEVAYVGEQQAHHQFADAKTCEQWRSAVAAGRYDYVVVEVAQGNPPPPALAWTRSSSFAQVLVSNEAGTVFAVRPGFGTEACPAG